MKTKLLLFGITGDLSTRKVLPAINNIIQKNVIERLEIIGVSRQKIDSSKLLEKSLGKKTALGKVKIFSMDIARAEEYERLRDYVDLKKDEQLLIYLSVPPGAAARIVDFLGEADLNTPNVKILFEKPFGVDHMSASEIISRTGRYYKEGNIYRVDHYLAKEMAQNVVALRGGNALFSHLWDEGAIEKIEIEALETIGVEGRATFYEQTGALRDVLQGHLMQLLALILMEIPPDFDWNKLPSLRLKALQSIELADPKKALRAQYDTYQAEVANLGSKVETFVSIELNSSLECWKNIPLILTTGKALNRKTTEIRIYLRKYHEIQSNLIIFHIQPNEGIEIDLFTKRPGYERSFQIQKLSFNYPEETNLPDAYEQVIVDAIRSHKSLFTTSNEVLRSWEILQPILDDWNISGDKLQIYKSGEATHNICSVK